MARVIMASGGRRQYVELPDGITHEQTGFPLGWATNALVRDGKCIGFIDTDLHGGWQARIHNAAWVSGGWQEWLKLIGTYDTMQGAVDAIIAAKGA